MELKFILKNTMYFIIVTGVLPIFQNVNNNVLPRKQQKKSKYLLS